MNAIVYLFQVSACMGIFYLFYYLLLSRYTFFTINRWYLIVTMAICFVIPLLTITVQQQETYPQVIRQVVYINQMQTPRQLVITGEAPEQVKINWMGIVKIIYIASVAALLLRLMLMVFRFFARIRGKKSTKIDGVHILQGDEKLSNGSFFNFIFLNDDELSADELEQIIAHEMLHVKLYHSVDRMLVKIAQVFLWFNPFVYLCARAIEENHEFEVDRAISNSTDRNRYAELLFHLSVARQGTLYHNFSMVPLKKRITMLFTKPTNRMKRIIYLLVVPVVLISCLAFAKLKNEVPAKTKKPANVTADDSATVRYRQKSKLTPAQRKAQDEAFKVTQAYFESGEGLKKAQAASALTGKTMTFEVEDNEIVLHPNPITDDRATGIKLKGTGGTYSMFPVKGLKNLKKGDIVIINIRATGYSMKSPLINIMPEWVTKDGKRIFEAEKLPNYPFGYESNKVRFSYGKFTDIEKYPNGKWKTAVFNAPAGYKFNLSFKSNAPDLRNIKAGKEVTLRFVHEVKTGDKTYKINDWVAISTDIKDYGVKNPDFFYKFYEVVKADTGKVSAFNGIESLGAKPLVLINGKEYDKDILYKISNRGLKGWSMYPPNNGNTQYGDKAKDGAIVIETRDGEITYLTANERENILKQRAAKGKFFSRIGLTKADGSRYDIATVTRATGSSASADLPVDGKIAFIINGKVYNETEFKRRFKTDKASYGNSIGVGGASKELIAKGYKVEGYDLVFEFSTGISTALKANVTPVKSASRDTVGKRSREIDKMLANVNGVTVKADGSLWVNNQKVTRARINGKDYTQGVTEKAAKVPQVKVFVEGKDVIPREAEKTNNSMMEKSDLLNKVPVSNTVHKNLNDSLVAVAFSGTVSQVQAIMGTTLVIIRNGDYFAAYSNLKKVNVTQGQQVKAGQLLGIAAFNNYENKVAAHFELYRNTIMITDKSEQEVIIRDLGQQRLNMRLKLGEVYAFKL